MRAQIALLIATLANHALADNYSHGAAAGHVRSTGAHGVTHYVSPEFELHDGLAVLYVRAGGRRVARQVVHGFAARLFPDLHADGKITAGDVWLARDGGTPPDRLLLSSARRLLYETLPQTTWLGQDQLGSLSVETNGTAEVIGRRSFAPFGKSLRSSGDAERYGFTSQEADDTGMLHFRFRQLDLASGRWAAPDPLFESATPRNVGALGQSSTAFAYVANRPTHLVDPSGLGGRPSKAARQPPGEPAEARFERIVRESNPNARLGRRGNCGHCAMATMKNIHLYQNGEDRIVQARPRNDVFLNSQVEEHFGGTFQQVDSFEQVASQMEKMGEYTQGLVSMDLQLTSGTVVGHLINVVKADGRVHFIDASLGYRTTDPWQVYRELFFKNAYVRNVNGVDIIGFLIPRPEVEPMAVCIGELCFR